MKIFKKGKDGGPKSTVTGYWLIEWKQCFSIVLLRFDGASREAYHNHAFNCYSWVLKGTLIEQFKDGNVITHSPSVLGFATKRDHFHKVDSVGTSYVLSIRGPWSKTWNEYDPKTNESTTLESGRVIVDGE